MTETPEYGEQMELFEVCRKCHSTSEVSHGLCANCRSIETRVARAQATYDKIRADLAAVRALKNNAPKALPRSNLSAEE